MKQRGLEGCSTKKRLYPSALQGVHAHGGEASYQLRLILVGMYYAAQYCPEICYTREYMVSQFILSFAIHVYDFNDNEENVVERFK